MIDLLTCRKKEKLAQICELTGAQVAGDQEVYFTPGGFKLRDSDRSVTILFFKSGVLTEYAL